MALNRKVKYDALRLKRSIGLIRFWPSLSSLQVLVGPGFLQKHHQRAVFLFLCQVRLSAYLATALSIVLFIQVALMKPTDDLQKSALHPIYGVRTDNGRNGRNFALWNNRLPLRSAFFPF